MKGGFCKEQQKSVGQMSHSHLRNACGKREEMVPACVQVSRIFPQNNAELHLQHGSVISYHCYTLCCVKTEFEGSRCKNTNMHLFLLNPPTLCFKKNLPLAMLLTNLSLVSFFQ